MLRLILVGILVSILTGCMTIGPLLEEISPHYAELMEEQRKQSGPDEVQQFQKLLREGWELYLYNDSKLILVKYTDDRLLINDVFGGLERDD
jgi:hypothetical protein